MTLPPTNRSPIDIIIISWVLRTVFAVALLAGVLLLVGFITFPDPELRPILFGLIYIKSELAAGIYWTLTGSLGLLASIGLAKLHKYSWWVLLILIMENVVMSIIMLPQFIYSGSVVLAIEISLIVWLFYRRGYYTGTKWSQHYSEKGVA